jgi:murein L,D-transpeptidase YcbB/YkuD
MRIHYNRILTRARRDMMGRIEFRMGKVMVSVLALLFSTELAAQSIGFKQSLAQYTVSERSISSFYRARDYRSFWTGPTVQERARLQALITAFADADMHGLPKARFNAEVVVSKLRAADSESALGQLEAELTKAFLDYASAVRSGLLIPSEIDEEIVRKVRYSKPLDLLEELEASAPQAFFKSLPPQSRQYMGLVKEKLRLERQVAAGGWGRPVSATDLKPGEQGAQVVALRHRLVAMGYLSRSYSSTYDRPLTAAVARFQSDHGLAVTGQANKLTLEQVNIAASERLASVMVALERERWFNQSLGARHISVNLTDFKAKIVDFDRVTFETNSVVGAADDDRRSPEFSDTMEYMVVNPSWYVPRSIVVGEYLPMLQEDAASVEYLELRDDLGNVVARDGLDFTSFDEETFPFGMRQPPSPGNALGLVKFMFPNRHNIYLHDTPAKNLFGREVRAFSHGCIRLADPFDFAYALLAAQSDTPKAVFQEALDSGEEVQIDLARRIPVHIIYRTALARPEGGLEFRADVYGRDAKIWQALQREGVVMGEITG